MGAGSFPLQLVALVLSLHVCVLCSSSTPFSLPLTVEAALHLVPFSGEISIRGTEDRQECSEADFLLDYAYQEETSRRVRNERGERAYARMWGRDRDNENYEAVFSQYLQALNVTSVFILSNSDSHNLSLAHTLLSTQPGLYRDIYVVASDAEYAILRKVVGRQIKPRGVSFVAVLMGDLGAYYFLRAVEDNKLNKPGYAYFLSQEAGLYRYLPLQQSGLLASGPLIISDSAAVARTREDFESLVLADQLRLLQERYEGEWHLERTPTIALLTVNHSQTTVAARSPLEVNKEMKVQFPGNSTAFPTIQKPKIKASVNYRFIQPDMSSVPNASQLMRGFEVAFREANNRTDLIPNYYLEDVSVSFTGSVFNYTLSEQQVLMGLKDLGLVYMSPAYANSIIGMTNLFADLNVTVPITSGSVSSELSDPRKYPLFVRPRVANGYQTLVMCRLIKYFAWRKIAVLVASDGAVDAYSQLVKIAGIFDIDIVNSEETRILPALLNDNTTEIVQKALSDIMASDTRIIFIMHTYIDVIMEQMYDLGIREQYVILTTSGLINSVFSDPSFHRRRVVSKGALMFFPRMFVGSIGAKVHDQLTSIDHDNISPNTCFFYDSAYLYFYATQYLLERGLDYEDPYLIVKAMRETHFYGCSGFVKIQPGTNDRDGSEFMITNFQYDSKKDTFELKIVGSYNPYSSQPYLLTSQIQWPDDRDVYSDVKPLYQNCRYLHESVKVATVSRTIGISACFGLTVVSLAATVPQWRKWWSIQYPLLLRRESMTLEDLLALVSVVFDFFLFASVGPDLSHFSPFLYSVCAGFGLDLEAISHLGEGVFLLALDITFGAVCLWVGMCALTLTRARALLEKHCTSLRYRTEIFMPSVGNLLLVPIVTTLTSVFLCYRGISESSSDAILNKDCGVFCWRGAHLGYVLGSAVCFLAYVPLAIATKPHWQELQSNVHVKTQPTALLAKSSVQVVLTVNSSTLKHDFPSIHICTFFVVMTLYLLWIFCFRQFNYERLNLWQFLLTVATLSLSIAGYISPYYSGDQAKWVVFILVAESSVLLLVGVVLQCAVKRFRSKLIREQGKDLRGLFRFAFTGGTQATEGLQEFYRSNQGMRYQLSGIQHSNQNT